MKIRKYVARNMPEALQQVRDDLGDQAVILNTRQLRGNNRYNPNGEAHVEETAAYDDAVPSVTPVQAETGVTPAGLAARRYSRTTEGSVAPEPRPLAQAASQAAFPVAPQTAEQSKSQTPFLAPSAPAPEPELAPVLRQLRQLQEGMERLERRTAGGVTVPDTLARLAERWRNIGMVGELIDRLVQRVFLDLDQAGLEDRDQVRQQALTLCSEMLPPCRDLKIGRQCKAVGFIGASGAGKTTAVAKIAAGFAMKRAKTPDRVLIISTDDKRVGAQEQIQRFAKIIGVPLETAYDEAQIRQALERHPRTRLVLVDTPWVWAARTACLGDPTSTLGSGRS